MKEKKEPMVIFCPECNSTDIVMDNSNVLIGVAGVPADYICTNCNYTARVFPEIEESEAKKLVVKKVVDKQTEKVDVEYGRFGVNVLWKILGPAFILLGLFMFFTYNNSVGQTLLFPIFLLVMGVIISYYGYKKKNGIKK